MLLLMLPYFLLLLLRALAAFGRQLVGREGHEPTKRDPCYEIPEHIRRKPDPCLYSQEFIIKNYPGVPVTWDNPDIWLTELDGTMVNSPDLQPAHDYIVHGRIWNASFDPAIGTQVRCYYRSFGYSSPTDTPVETNANGTEKVVVLHIGAWQNQVATFKWKTPPEPGHYCLLVKCSHADDAQPGNNVGQHNTNVVSTEANTTITIAALLANHNQKREQLFQFRADTYQIPSGEVELQLDTLVQPLDQPGLWPTSGPKIGGQTADGLQEKIERLLSSGSRGPVYVGYVYRGLDTIVERNRAVAHAIPPGWRLTIDQVALDEALRLDAGETRMVNLEIAVPASAEPGSRVAFNVTALGERMLPVGGVTVYVEIRG